MNNAPITRRERLAVIGPGAVLAALAIGSGELILTPRSGAQYGFQLLWVPILTILYKALFSDALARITVASGNDVFQAFASLPGPKRWAQSAITVVFLADMVGYGGIALATAASLHALFPASPSPITAMLVVAATPVLIYSGSYRWFERVVMAMCAALLAGVLYTLLQTPLPLDEMARGCVPRMPAGSASTVTGLMGWIGAGTTTLLYSTWVHEKIGTARDETEYRQWIAAIRLDYRLSYVLILLVSLAFLTMGATILHPRGLVPEKDAVMTVLAQMLDGMPWGGPVFFVTAFFTLFSTIVSCVDGKSRAIAAMAQPLAGGRVGKLALYRIVMGVCLAIMLATAFLGSHQPVKIINLVASMNAVAFGVLGFMLLYLDMKLPVYARGSRIWRIAVGAGSAVFLGAAFLT